jgi:hypothetical protein
MNPHASQYLLRVFEVQPHGSTETPVPLPERHVEAGSLDDARDRAAALLANERRPLRSISFLAGGGLVAYVLPPLPEPAPAPEQRRRPRGRR